MSKPKSPRRICDDKHVPVPEQVWRDVTLNDCKVPVWEERDRLHIQLKYQDKTVAEWWDDDARQMFEDGFFKSGRKLAQSVFDYCREMKLI